MLTQILLPIAATVVAHIILHVLLILYRNLTSPLRKILPGPAMPTFILGNSKQMTDNPNKTSEWSKEFGPSFLFHGLFSVSELYTSDLKALNHIITHSDIYVREDTNGGVVGRIMDDSILVVVGDQHKRQRRVMNPAFGLSQIREVTEIFVDKAVELRDFWKSEIAQQRGTIEVYLGLRQMTLNIIGRAGFGYEFNALSPHGKSDELNDLFTDLFHSPKSNFYAKIRLSQRIIPILKWLPLPGQHALRSARTRMFAIGSQIVNQSKASLSEEAQQDKDDNTLSGRRDLLSILLKANLSASVPDSQKLSDVELVAQIPAFFIAGHETTSSASAWALHALSLNKAIQTKLREELLTVGTDNPTLDQLNALPYLEQVVRETLRVHAPVPFRQRTAMADDVIPLSKPVIDKQGREHWSLPISKGQVIHLPIKAVNTSEEIWGEDALEFRPERWDHTPDAANGVPGIWANLFTFFAGPNNCIGFRFSLAELKVILFTLVRAFEIDPALPKGAIGPVLVGQIQRPGVLREKEQKSGLPLILTPLTSD
ncbi:cytochrome P450 [Mycena amicta]|nr:cytochrome P450 [Mycena amicta]